MSEQPDNISETRLLVRLDTSTETVEIDFSVPRTIRIIPLNSKGTNKEYYLKITPKGGATLV